MKGANVTFLDVCMVAKPSLVRRDGGPLVGSKHEATVTAHGSVFELEWQGVIIFGNVFLQVILCALHLKVLWGQRKGVRAWENTIWCRDEEQVVCLNVPSSVLVWQMSCWWCTHSTWSFASCAKRMWSAYQCGVHRVSLHCTKTMILQLAKVLDTPCMPAFVFCFMLDAVPTKARDCFGKDSCLCLPRMM